MDMMTVFETWDGKTTASLQKVADQLTPAQYQTLLAACRAQGKTARAASWVLKAAYEAGTYMAFPADVLADHPHWEVALHLLQSVQYVGADVSSDVVQPYLSHEKPMVRAWALDAYAQLDGPDVSDALARAADDPAASVRARARNLAK